jgi:long-chain acyl-CoA synthetase
VGEFKSLVGYLALTHEVDVVPIWLGGTYEAMPKGTFVPLRRDVRARIGPVLRFDDLARLTKGLSSSDGAREASKMMRVAVLALKEGGVLDLSRIKSRDELEGKQEHPLVTLFSELETRFKPGGVQKPISFYFTLGNDDLAKWTVKVAPDACEVRAGKPDGGAADCVLKTSPEIFARIVREAFVPGPAEFMSGQVKSNDVELLLAFGQAFTLGEVRA